MIVSVPWLLRQVRRYGADGSGLSGAALAAGVPSSPDETGFPTVHRSQVTRWETGATACTYAIARRYERGCGLRRHQLVTAIDLLYRDDRPRGTQPRLPRPTVADPAPEAERLLTRLLDGQPATGDDWDRLSFLIGLLPGVLLVPRDWHTLVRRGIQELDVSVGPAYLQRAEAMARLCSQPRAADAVVDLVGEMLTSPATQVYAEAAALLQFVDSPLVADLLTEVVADPVNERALRGALFASATDIRGRHSKPAESLARVRAAHDYMVDPSQSYPVRKAAADVLLALTPAARRRIARTLGEDTGAGSAASIASIVQGWGPLGQHEMHELQRRLLHRLGDSLGTAWREDRELRALVSAMTTVTNDDHRSHALHLLMVAPFGRAFGEAYLEELADAIGEQDVSRVHEVLGVLLCLTPVDDLGLLLDLATREHPLEDRDGLARQASYALGNAKFGLVDLDTVGTRIGAMVSAALAGEVAAGDEEIRAWGYALGRLDLLDRVVEPRAGSRTLASAEQADRAAAHWQRARDWWRALPPHVARAARED